MKNFIKQNWFKVSLIIIALIFALGFLYDIYSDHKLTPKEKVKLELEKRIFDKSNQ